LLLQSCCLFINHQKRSGCVSCGSRILFNFLKLFRVFEQILSRVYRESAGRIFGGKNRSAIGGEAVNPGEKADEAGREGERENAGERLLLTFSKNGSIMIEVSVVFPCRQERKFAAKLKESPSVSPPTLVGWVLVKDLIQKFEMKLMNF
jgi:hypothetical protein